MEGDGDVNLTNDSAKQVSNFKSEDPVQERRVSPRLESLPKDKRPYYGSDDLRNNSVSPEDDNAIVNGELNSLRDNSGTGNKKSKIDHSIQECQTDVKDISNNGGSVPIDNGILILKHDDEENVELLEEEEVYQKWADYKGFLDETIRQKADERVAETLQIFNKLFEHFTQEEVKRCEKEKPKNKQRDKEKNKDGNSVVKAKHSIMRPDLKAATEMGIQKEVLYPEKKIGHLPGIPVGYKFKSRCEMVALGFHGHWLNGIDYISKSSKEKNCNYTCPVAVTIVMSGEYEDDVDYKNEVVYTGQGGKNKDGIQIKDQVMLRGNLALKNSMDQRLPVRFVRGYKLNDDSGKHKVYIYCGLYKVVSYWSEKGANGFSVFKYRLIRLLGQPKVDTELVQFRRAGASKICPKLEGLVCEDISFGEEDMRIPATNLIDDPPIAPAGFKYTKSVQVASNITVPPSASGCSCKGNCSISKSCSCAQLNGSDFPYVENKGGRLIEPKDVVYECGPGCECGHECINRVSQRRLKYRLEVFRVENKGWAVRSWDTIPSGAPVCEYTGVLRRNIDLDNVSGNDYIFDIDCWHTMKGIGGREKREADLSSPTSDLEDKKDDNNTESESEFCIDAGACGSVARFINHSCKPNLFVQCVLSSHHDVRLARVMLFAADNIPAMQELTYDYGYALDSVIGPDGKIKEAPCFCGTEECRGRLF